MSAKASHNKQIHDKYGKKVLSTALGNAFNQSPEGIFFDPIGRTGGSFRIDGIIDGNIAVEIESRSSKQVRGAVLDLALHPLPKKLLILIKMYGNDYTPQQCRILLNEFCDAKSRFFVIELKGTGKLPKLDADVKIVKTAVSELRNSNITRNVIP